MIKEKSIMHETELITNFNKLTQSQQNRIQREIIDFCNLNDRLGDNRPYQCPYCHKKTKMIKKGFARGKQRYLCMECEHKFTYDSHMITSFLKIDVDEFIEICIDTLTMVPIHKTAARLNRSIKCVFLNRHKFLSMLEKYLESGKIQLSGAIECDETYVLKSSKGSSLKHIEKLAIEASLQGLEEYPMNKYVSSPQQIEMNTRYFWQLANPDQPKILYRIPSKIILHNSLSSTQTEQIVITLWQNVRIAK